MPNPARSGLPNPASYTANADGTVSDDVTGLTWEGTVDGTRYMQADAKNHCAAKGAGWRLPTRLELVSLVDFTVAAPGPTIDPIFANAPPEVFWTSSPYYGDVGDAWYVGFAPVEDYRHLDEAWLAGQPPEMATLLGRENFLGKTTLESGGAIGPLLQKTYQQVHGPRGY